MLRLVPLVTVLFCLSACGWLFPKRDKPEPTSSRRAWCEHEGVSYAVGAGRDEDCARCACVELDDGGTAWECAEAPCETSHSGS